VVADPDRAAGPGVAWAGGGAAVPPETVPPETVPPEAVAGPGTAWAGAVSKRRGAAPEAKS
jgi:hypothetical protein